jgi:hypothetical protein
MKHIMLFEAFTNSGNFSMIMPCDGTVKAIGDFSKDTKESLSGLKNLISDIDTMEYVGISTASEDVCCPVAGTIQGIRKLESNQQTLYIVEHDTEFGRVYTILMGTPDFTVNPGDKTEQQEKLCTMPTGSEIAILYEVDSFRGDILVGDGKYMVGDGIFQNIDVISPTEFGDLPNTEFTRNDQKTGLIIGADTLGSPRDASIF